jgi:hypothetical protein
MGHALTGTITLEASVKHTRVGRLIAAVLFFLAPTVFASTWYVRQDGGSRYSVNNTAGQCDGTADVSYAGTGGIGVNKHCAFNDVRFLWTDGSFTTDPNAGAPKWGWIGTTGDTYIIRGSIADGVTWRVGQSGPNSGQGFGLQGDPFAAGAPLPPRGVAARHTKILGGNFASCHSATAKTQLHGGFGVGAVLNMSGASYVDVACLDITDFSSCGKQGQINGCNSGFPLDDYASNGISWNNSSHNNTLTDVHIHGLANSGMVGPTGYQNTFSYLDLIGNASAGWNADAGDGTTGSGPLLVQNFNISWNGCSEEYPIVHALPYGDCTDDGVEGYGDGFGTATVASNPAWNVTFDQGTVSYNTQDGLDALHLVGNGSSMTISRVLAYGNMGQQIKVGGAGGSAINNVIVGNCNALRQPIPGTPAGYNTRLSDFCRAADTGIVLTVGNATPLKFDFNTIYSANTVAIEVDCDTSSGPCTNAAKIDFRNNIFVGFLSSVATGYPNGGDNDFPNPFFNGTGVDIVGNPGSLYSNNITFHPRSNWTCPAAHELNAFCGDPQLVDETWHVFDFGNVAPISNTSPPVGNGVAISGITTDFTGATRSTPPSEGAYEH